MKDRVVEHPGRYQMVPVDGTTDTYDFVAVPGTVTEVGTDLSKENLLTDATAALYGLGEDAVPDDALMAVNDKFGNCLLRDMNLMLNLSLATTNIDAWADLLTDSTMINSSLSSGYTVSDGYLAPNNQTITRSSVGSGSIKFGYSSRQKIGQTFYVTVTGTISSISIYLDNVGSPTDSIAVNIYSISDGVPSSLLYSSTPIIGSTLETAIYTFSFSNAYVTEGNTYAFVLERSGEIDDTNYYFTYLNYSSTAYSEGARYEYGGSSWVEVASDVNFSASILGSATVVWNEVTATEAFSSVAITADQTGDVTWYMSDDGMNWIEITDLDTSQLVSFDATSVYIKCILSSSAEVSAVAWGGY